MAAVQVDDVTERTHFDDVTWSLSGSSVNDQVKIKIEDTSDPLEVIAAIDRMELNLIQYLGTLGTP